MPEYYISDEAATLNTTFRKVTLSVAAVKPTQTR